MFNRILVAIDGSPTSNHGFTVALDVAKEQQAELYAVHVVDDTRAARSLVGGEFGVEMYYERMLEDMREAGGKLLAKAETAAAKNNQSIKPMLVEGRGRGVADTIVAHARKIGADLIVMGTHGRRGLSRLVVGSDAEGVLREARVPVLLVRNGAAQHTSRATPRTAVARKRSARPAAGVRA